MTKEEIKKEFEEKFSTIQAMAFGGGGIFDSKNKFVTYGLHSVWAFFEPYLQPQPKSLEGVGILEKVHGTGLHCKTCGRPICMEDISQQISIAEERGEKRMLKKVGGIMDMVLGYIGNDTEREIAFNRWSALKPELSHKSTK